MQHFFDRMVDHGYGTVHLGRDQAAGLRAIVAVHDVRLGPALGGCRFIPYATEDDALVDALRLARAMTAKAALAGLAHGGGKAVIMRPAGEFDRRRLFEAFGRFVDGLGGRYITTEDSGTGIEDMEVVRGVTRHVTGFDVAQGGSGDPSPFTALGVRRGIEACVKQKLGRDSLQGVHVAVKGVGHVGYALCKELHALGARLTVADIDEATLQTVCAKLDAEAAPVDRIHAVDCDVFAPCALGSEIDDSRLSQLRCAIVAGAANNQLAEMRHGDALMERGILYAPDYAINAGGLINVAQEVQGYDASKARDRTLRIYDTIIEIAERATAEGMGTHRVADRMVQERLARAGAAPRQFAAG